MPTFSVASDASSEGTDEIVLESQGLFGGFYVGYDSAREFEFGGIFNAPGLTQGADITTAYVTIDGDTGDYSAGFQGRWRGYLVTSVSAFSASHVHSLENHDTLTTAAVVDNSWANQATHQSPSLVDIIQEIVNQPSWPDGGQIGLMFEITSTAGGWFNWIDNSAEVTIEWASGNFTQSLTATLSFAGAINKQANIPLAGALSFAGSLTSQIIVLFQQAVGGALSFAGAINKQARISLAGAISPTGAINKIIQKSLAGSLTFQIPAGGSVRFYGTGSGNIDRIWIPLEVDSVRTPVGDLGDDFTIEFRIRAAYADNTALITDGDNRYRNAILDRDIWSDVRGWTVAMARDGSNLVVSFAIAGTGLTWTTITGSIDIGDDQFHEVSITRRRSDGLIQIRVDGTLDAQGTLYNGDLRHTIGQDNSPITGADLQLVPGAEKHDAGSEFPSGNFYMDELRISDIRRYTSDYTPASTPFTADANTVALYHCDDGSGTTLSDSATITGSPTNGTLLVGGVNNGPTWETATPFSSINLTMVFLAVLTGVIGPAGALGRSIFKGLSGAIGPTGSLTSSLTGLFQQAVGGVLSFAGALNKQTQKGLTGQISPTGTVNKLASISLAGAVSFAGALNKVILKTLSGAISPTGAVGQGISKSLAGVLSFTGTAGTAVAKAIGGVIGPSGTVSGQLITALIQQAVGGALSFAGAINKQARISLAGAISPTGVIGKRISIALTGTLNFIGSISSGFVQALTGAVSFAGSLQKTARINLTGVLSTSGTIQKNIMKFLSGAISPTGVGSGAINTLATAVATLTARVRNSTLTARVQGFILKLRKPGR